MRTPTSEPNSTDAKAYGAFYTDAQIAEFLTWWAIRHGNETVLDPSFGGGVFLRESAKRLLELGGDARHGVYGVELDKVVHESIAKRLGDEFGIPVRHLTEGDFFRQPSPSRYDVIVGNPPFIRYQKFTGENRRIALRRAAEAGVRLSELSSAWAPFLVVSISQVRKGGRLAMVAPMELCHASYAKPVLQYLSRTFEKVTLLTFREPLFPEISESTVLVLAENRGYYEATFRHRDFENSGALARLRESDNVQISGAKRIDAKALQAGPGRFVQYLIPSKARELWAELAAESALPLGDIADVGIGYVSGANDFFHLSPEDVSLWDVSKEFLKPIVCRSRGLKGLRLTTRDWQENLKFGESSYLLHVAAHQSLSGPVRRYIQNGESQGVHLGYKCRNRSPWYRVPHVRQPDAFLSYMSTRSPRLVLNEAEAFAPNTLHILRFKPHPSITPQSLAAAWHTSFARLSCELQGHALGGGMLKLEPTEAESVLLPRFQMDGLESLGAMAEIDAFLRQGADARAQEAADRYILRKQLNLTKSECKILSEAVASLQERRMT